MKTQKTNWEKPIQDEARQRADVLVHEAEAAKARIFTTPGNHAINFDDDIIEKGGSIEPMHHPASTIVDENYLMIGAYLEQGLQEKIVRGEYVDFTRVLPQERSGEDHCMELMYKGGNTYFVPAADRESAGAISNFHKWEQAFRVFANIYTRAHPARATELIQYNHIICTAVSSYMWDNVYMYDREFRMHMGCYPGCNWSVILQQAWTMVLKDRIRYHDQYKAGNQHAGKPKKEICKCFNKGLCTAGLSCKYDHRCLECGKFGHGAHICRRKSGNASATHAGTPDTNCNQASTSGSTSRAGPRK